MPDNTENIHEGHRKSVRERYIKSGSLEGYADHQILEMLLFYAIKRRDVNPLAHRLINRFGSLKAVLKADHADLMAQGLSESTATLLKLVGDIGIAIDMREAYETEIRTVDDAIGICHGLLFREQTETVALLCLDPKNRVTKIRFRTEGFADKVEALPKWVVDTALSGDAAAIIIAHNHPSGSVEPSSADRETTALLQSLLAPLGIKLFDHIIVTRDAGSSMMRSYVRTGILKERERGSREESEEILGSDVG
ncbi:MAG: hypothetical protein IK064_05240 [Clostridia bacterium]|nr:hypothetical protein [Clostridia bacterium]